LKNDITNNLGHQKPVIYSRYPRSAWCKIRWSICSFKRMVLFQRISRYTKSCFSAI